MENKTRTNRSNSNLLKANLLLFIAAVIWGLAFVAQRVGAQYMGPFTFNGIRFALGSISLLPLLYFFRNRDEKRSVKEGSLTNVLIAGIIAGVILFIAASLQQYGMIVTSAGKAAFITGLYIVLVPIFGMFLKHRITAGTFLGAVVAAIGLYFLCVTDGFSISYYDLIEVIGAFFWAVHILVIDYYSNRVSALKLAFTQFFICSLLSLVSASVFENITIEALSQALVPILYGGICSVGVAYTLQIIGQKHAQPAHAAIILSLETVVAVIGGYFLLDETMGARGILGCIFMLAGMLLSQLQNFKKEDTQIPANSSVF